MDPSLNLFKTYALIQEYARLAENALRDEHEGNVKYYTDQMAGLAVQVDAFVKGM